MTSFLNRNVLLLTKLVLLACGFEASLQSAPLANSGLSQLKRPYVITHRGGPLLWPEHTMEAYQASVDAGSQFVEVDCYALKDGSVVIMHDEMLERTTTGKGSILALSGADLGKIKVDGQKLLGSKWQQYRIPYFDEVLARFGNRKVIFVEIKNALAATAVVEKLKNYKISNDFVVVSAFGQDALKAARAAGYKTCLNLGDESIPPKDIRKMKHWGVSCPVNTSEAYVRAIKQEGLVVLVYTPRNHMERDTAMAKGADGFYCDDPIYMSFDTGYRRQTDPFEQQTWYPGMLEAQPGGRGYFTAPNRWGLDTSAENVYRGCLQGWLSPMKNGVVAPEWSVEVSVTFGPGLMEARWASLAILTTDTPLESDIPRGSHFGFNFLFHNNSGLSIYKYAGESNAAPNLLGTTPGRGVEVGITLRYRVTITPTQLRAECLNTGVLLVVNDVDSRGAYITLGTKGQKAEFSKINLKY